MSDTSAEEQQDIPIHVPSLPNADVPLTESYTYHSPLPTSKGPYVIGVDEAGRGPVLGPLVYGIAYCPVSYQDKLNDMGFADSKTLSSGTRGSLLSDLGSDPQNLGWSVRVISPQAISNGMLRRPPINLNRQSEDATILLLREITDKLQVSEVYVDALGPTETYQAHLSRQFPGISFTVTKKADSKYKIVGAASIAAKVTRDACLHSWVFEELSSSSSMDHTAPPTTQETSTEQLEQHQSSSSSPPPSWSTTALGSGYPSDPTTKTWLRDSLEPTFGFPGLVRFSWTTVKVLLEQDGHDVKWVDDAQPSVKKALDLGSPQDKNRATFMKDLGLRSLSSF